MPRPGKSSRSSSLGQHFFSCVAFICISLLSGPGLAATVNLAWDPPSDITGLTGYKVYAALSGDIYPTQAARVITDPARTTCSVSGLIEGEIYSFVGTCTYDAGESPYSNEVFYQVPSTSTDGDGTSDKTELDQSSDPADTGDNTGVSRIDGAVTAFGTVQVDRQWTRLELPSGFSDPVVVAGPSSLNSDDPCVVRVRNVTPSGFEIRLQEYEYLDGPHPKETVSYLVMERGSYTLSDGTVVEAGRVEASTCHFDFDAVRFSSGFSRAPVVLSTVNSFNDASAVATRVNNVSTSGFTLQMQEQQYSDQVHGQESIGYVAWQPARGNAEGMSFEAGLTPEQVTDAPFAVQFTSGFPAAPIFLAGQQTRNGADTANLRLDSLSHAQARIHVDEEQSSNSEVSHIRERVGYLCLLPTDTGTVPDPADEPSSPSDLAMDHGRLWVGSSWTRVQLSREFVNPVVVAGPLSLNDPEPALVRIRNVTGTGFDICVQEFDYQDGSHGLESVSYLVMEKGSHTLSDGSVVEAGTFETGSTSFTTRALSAGFATAPVVMASVTSANEADAVMVRIWDVNPNEFVFHLQEEEGNWQSHAPETLSYIAWEPSMGTVNGLAYQVEATAEEVTDGFTRVGTTQAFASAPALLGAQQTRNGGDPAVIRVDNAGSAGFDVQVAEEQSKDSEVSHIPEVVGFMAFALPGP